MSTPLFLDNEASKIRFEKVGMSIRLSDNADNWQREISSEIYKRLPFLADFSTNVEIQRVNPERGFAFGSAQITNLREQPQPAGPVVIIPLLVTDRLLKPMDVFLFEGKAYPMSEQRVREFLFDGRTFETSNRKPVDQGMVDQLYPPIRTNYGYGSGVTTGAAAGGAGFGKFAEEAGLSVAIAPTIPEMEIEKVVDKIAEDQQLTNALRTNEGFRKLITKVASCPRASVVKTAAALVQSIRPTVVQFTKLADGNFRIKWAAAEAFAPQEQTFPPDEAAQMAGGPELQGLPPGESVTLGTGEAGPTLDDPTPTEISDFGQYEVQVEEDGSNASGWVLPVIDFEMNNLPLKLFTDGERYSLQDSIVGVRAGDSPEGLPEAPAQGDGAFVYHKPDGSLCATLPVTVQNQSSGPDGAPGLMCETAMGEQITLHPTPDLNRIEPMGEDSYAIPESMTFTPLSNPVHLASASEDVQQVKEARQIDGTGIVVCTGYDDYSLRGFPFAKLSADNTQWLKKEATEFLLVTAGLTQPQAREKMAEARKMGRSIVRGLNTITPLDHLHREAVKQAAALLSKFPHDLRKDTVKLAAALEDSETADKILAMNFINPENVSIFASYLPQLDETASKLAEMLMAARLGMSQVDEGVLERAMHNLEEVIQGLKGLEQKQLL